MRALALSAIAAMTASAQDVRMIPPAEPPVTLAPHDCDHGVTMPAPFSDAVPPAPMPKPNLDGPEPVPIPNLCAEPDPLAVAPMGGDARDFLRRNVRPLTYRLEEGQPLPPPYPDRLHQRYERFEARPTPVLPFRDALRLPPVAPREDRP